MVEANPSLARSQRQAQRQAERMRVEAQRRAPRGSESENPQGGSG